MTKRRRPTHVSDDDWEQGPALTSDVSTDLEGDGCETSFTLKRPRKSTTGRKASKRARDDNNGAKTFDCTHLGSLHLIREPAAMGIELLKWYKIVQNNRAMPWRKPYDPNLGTEQRAQRAYEVCLLVSQRICPCP
jgi:A/G-specific adenine glycosylase